jgi:hypothetical protein
MNVREHDGASIGAANHELGGADAQMQRPAERRAAQQRDAPAGNESERGHPFARHARCVDGGDHSAVIGREMIS